MLSYSWFVVFYIMTILNEYMPQVPGLATSRNHLHTLWSPKLKTQLDKVKRKSEKKIFQKGFWKMSIWQPQMVVWQLQLSHWLRILPSHWLLESSPVVVHLSNPKDLSGVSKKAIANKVMWGREGGNYTHSIFYNIKNTFNTIKWV